MESLCSLLPPYLWRKGESDFTNSLFSSTHRCRLRPLPPRSLSARPGPFRRGSAQIYDGQFKRWLPGLPLARNKEEAEKSNDPDCLAAWTGVDRYLSFCEEVLARASYDNRGSDIVVTVHYGSKYDNALWTGHQIVCGDGDGVIFGSYARDPSILYHEMTHAVIQYGCNFGDSGQAGSLNESCADAFSTACLQWSENQMPAQGSWLIGNVVMKRGAMRSLAHPGTAYAGTAIGSDPQPKTMASFYSGPDDDSGVHINCGIPNHAFYLFSTSLGGPVWRTPLQVWYRTISTPGRVLRDCNFSSFARGTLESCREVDGASLDRLNQAWRTVGVL